MYGPSVDRVEIPQAGTEIEHSFAQPAGFDKIG